MGLKIDGIAASQAIDTSAESIDIDGLDISSLEAGEGVFNYEHRNPKSEGASTLDVLGAITFAKKIMKESDCSNERELSYWKQIELPFVYIKGELFNDEEDEHVAAKAMAAIIQYYKRRKLPILVRFSIDGHTLERGKDNNNILKRAIARDVALTIKPANHSCVSDVLDSKAELEKRQNSDDPDHYLESGLYRFPSVSFSMLADGEEDPIDLIKTELENLTKAMSAGNYNVAPSDLSGGAALQTEDVSKSKKRYFINLVKGAFRDWNGRSNLKEHMAKSVPEASPEFLEKFTQLVDAIHLRKTSELHGHLEEIMKGGLDSAIAKLPKFDADPDKTGNFKVGAAQGGATPKMADPDKTNAGIKPMSQMAKPMGVNDQVIKDKFAQAGRVAEEHGNGNWSVKVNDVPASAFQPVPQPMKPAQGMMSSIISKFFPQKAPTSAGLSAPTKPQAAISDVASVHQNKMKQEGWNFTQNPGGKGWSATPPPVTPQPNPTKIAKAENPLLHTINGQFVEPTMLKSPYFDDIEGKLYAPEGVFPVAIPSEESVDSLNAFHDAANSLGVSAFHDKAMDGFRQLNTRLRTGQLPEPILKLGAWLLRKELSMPEHLKNWMGSMSQLDMNHNFDPKALDALRRVVEARKGSGRDIVSDAKDQHLAMTDKNARLAAGFMGAGDTIYPDDSLIRHLFGLDAQKDTATLKALKRSISVNPTIWDDLEKFYGNRHDAVSHVRNGQLDEHLKTYPKDCLLPAATKHWLVISAHDKAMGRSETPPMDIKVDEPHLKLTKGEDWPDIQPYANVINSWLAKYGPIMTMLMYFSMIVPKILHQHPSVEKENPNGGFE